MSNCLQHFSHNHPLQFTIWQYSVKINCRLCHLSIDDGQSYICHECSYIIHKACAELPNYIHHSLHPHHSPLRLDKRSPSNTSACYYCDNSFQNKETLAYACDQCSLHMHTTCALIPLPTIKCYSNQDNTDVIQYVCHQNKMPLVVHDDFKSQAKCFGCQSFWSGLAYSCTSTTCKNFLHKSCAELPLKIQHPFHLHHPLTLQVSKPQACKLCCKKDCRLTFSCQSGCSFNLGIECAFLRTTVKCQSHDHLLCFVEKAFCDIQCDACRKSYKKWNINVVPEEVNRNQFFLFRCMECDFNLHFLCGPLPLRIKYDYHIHPLNLVDHVVTEDDSNEYYCDICEDERKQDFRIYYCEDCKYTAHIHCLMSEIMKVIKENSKDVELMALGENLWYQFGAEKEMSNENEVTLKEVMNSLTREEKEILIDPYALVYPLSIKTQMEEDHSFYCRENSPLFDHELPSTEDIEKINQFPRFGESDASNFFLELRVYRPKEGLKLDEKYLRQKVVDVQGHIVPVTVAPILKTLLHKHGSDLFCGLLTREMKSVIATLLCVVIDRIYNTNIEDVTRDDIKEWVFCLKSIENITAVDVLNLVNFFQTVIVPVFLGFEAIRYEKDISEKLDLMIKNLEANLERCKEARRIFKTETCMRPDRVKDIMVSDALRWKGTKVNETASHAWKISG